jgi:hypothetical protein
MTAQLRATAAKPSVPAVSGLSKATDTQIRMSVSGLIEMGPDAAWIGFGKATTPPATYADLTNPDGGTLSAFDSASYAYGPSGWGGSVVWLGARANAGWTVGDSVYCCLLAAASPTSGTVVVASFGPLLVIA